MAPLPRKASGSFSTLRELPRRALPSLACGLLVVACGSSDDAVSFGGAGSAGTDAGERGGTSSGGNGPVGGSQGGSGKGGSSSKGGSGGSSSKGGSGGSSSPGGAGGAGGGSDVGGSGSGTAGNAGTNGLGGKAGGSGKGGATAGSGGKGGATAGSGGSGPAGAGGTSAGMGGSGTAGMGGSGTAGMGGIGTAGASGNGTAGFGGGGSGGAPPAPFCGDGIINGPNEACDGDDFGANAPVCPAGATGTVVCSPTCQRDTSGCVSPSTCGNGQIDGEEECDSDNSRCKKCKISCNSAEKAFEGHCYGATGPRSWAEAEAICVQRGGHLVTIGGAAENKVVYDLAGGNASSPLSAKVWLGLNDQKNEGTFAWVSGSNATYRNFRDGEPNAATSSEDCAAMYLQLGTWNDDECAKSFVGICEFNPQVP